MRYLSPHVIAAVLCLPGLNSVDDHFRLDPLSTIAERGGVTTRASGETHWRRSGSVPKSVPGVPKSQPVFETRWVVACPGNSVMSGDEVSTCGFAMNACVGIDGGGPLAQVWRRQVSPTAGPWTLAGSTCFPPGVARPGQPALTVEQVRLAFARTPFKQPSVVMQPPGGRTLVNLETFFEASFAGAGFGAGDVHSVSLLGRDVRIRVLSAGYKWNLGGGSALVTASAGGPWPDGDVRHTYDRAGEYLVRVSAVYRGEYSVDGGAWMPVGSTVTLSAPSVRLSVLTAQNRLLAD